MDREAFANPAREYRMKTIIHSWPEECGILADAVKDFGYGGTATNPPVENGYTGNKENLVRFGQILQELGRRDMDYWIYDEKGYPSGHGGGQSLEGHPELEAKGFYMRRRIAREPQIAVFDLDDESDRIIWAAKYPCDCTRMNTSIVLYDQMEPVEFTDTHCECDMKENEALFIFCVKSAYEGSHLTHNVSSKNHYINILDKKAVRRFLDVCYEPIIRDVPEAYKNACAVFTDEPSLQTPYIQGDEVWPYALAPWAEGLFEAFEEEYGYSLLPYLPMIFEGRSSSYTVRVHFYQLIGKLIAGNYVKQISDWCEEHGTCFSGHYLAEESLRAHVLYYGSYLEVLRAAGYPGVDVLASYPDIYHHNTTRFAQMAARKNGTNGVMVELCPFINMDHFSKHPVRYAAGILSLLYLGGCRCVNSYFSSDFSAYHPEVLKGYQGFMSREQSIWLNEYTGRLGSMLDQAGNECGTFVYYALEEVQAKTRPSHCAQEASDSPADRSIFEITRRLFDRGMDYLFADRDDIVAAADSISGNQARISGCRVENIIVPAMDVIYPETWEALIRLQEAGTAVWFADKLPKYRVGEKAVFAYYDFREESVLGEFTADGRYFAAKSSEQIVQEIETQEKEFIVQAGVPNSLLTAKYQKDGKTIYFVVNKTEEKQEAAWQCRGKEKAEVWNPADGSIVEIIIGENVTIDACCGMFFVF